MQYPARVLRSLGNCHSLGGQSLNRKRRSSRMGAQPDNLDTHRKTRWIAEQGLLRSGSLVIWARLSRFFSSTRHLLEVGQSG